MPETIIEIKQLKKHFGKIKAVNGVSFSVNKGEIFGFLGPNGAGKSTTMRCLMGFNKPTSGAVEIFGLDMTKKSVKAKEYIGYLPSDIELYDDWTGWDHIRFFESVRGRSETVNSLIERFGFNPDVKFRSLSSGNKQKLGLILALMSNPKLIIMDEPTVGLDPLLQSEIYKVLFEMRDMGSTIFISSHNLPEVQKICDRVAVIRSGEIVAIENIKTLNKKKIHKIQVRFKDKYTLKEFKVQGVNKIERIEGGLLINSIGDINAIMMAITRHKLIDLEVEHASLEDVFMKFYEENK